MSDGPLGAKAIVGHRVPHTYPEHLRPCLAGLPAAPGVYTFHGAASGLPLYIGKSVNIRARVMSHFNTADEAAMLRQTVHVSFERTAGEIGALLLESARIKAEHPLFNQRLRRSRQLWSVRFAADRPDIVPAREADVSAAAADGPLYGLFGSPRAAQEHLRQLADTHGLCCGLLGLEKLASGRPCFRHQIRRCLGACCGAEPERVHHARLMGALQAHRIATWPHDGAVAVLERDGDLQDIHVVRNWCHLGTVATLEEARALKHVSSDFDADSYHILSKALLTGAAQIMAL